MNSQKQFDRLGCCRSWRSVDNEHQLLLVCLSGRAVQDRVIRQPQRESPGENVPQLSGVKICCYMKSMCSSVLCSGYETRPFRLPFLGHTISSTIQVSGQVQKEKRFQIVKVTNQ